MLALVGGAPVFSASLAAEKIVCATILSESVSAEGPVAIRLAAAFDDRGEPRVVKSQNGALQLVLEEREAMGRVALLRGRAVGLDVERSSPEEYLALATVKWPDPEGIVGLHEVIGAVDAKGRAFLYVSADSDGGRAIREKNPQLRSEAAPRDYLEIDLRPALLPGERPRGIALARLHESEPRLRIFLVTASRTLVRDVSLDPPGAIRLDLDGASEFRSWAEHGGEFIQALDKDEVLVADEHARVHRVREGATEELARPLPDWVVSFAAFRLPGEPERMWCLASREKQGGVRLLEWRSGAFEDTGLTFAEGEVPRALAAAAYRGARPSGDRFDVFSTRQLGDRVRVLVAVQRPRASGSMLVLQGYDPARRRWIFPTHWYYHAGDEPADFSPEVFVEAGIDVDRLGLGVQEIFARVRQRLLVGETRVAPGEIGLVVDAWLDRLYSWRAVVWRATGIASSLRSLADDAGAALASDRSLWLYFTSLPDIVRSALLHHGRADRMGETARDTAYAIAVAWGLSTGEALRRMAGLGWSAAEEWPLPPVPGEPDSIAMAISGACERLGLSPRWLVRELRRFHRVSRPRVGERRLWETFLAFLDSVPPDPLWNVNDLHSLSEFLGSGE